MSVLKVSDFAVKYGIRRTNVYVYRDRRKLIIEDGFLDESNPINKLWISERSASEIKKIHEPKKLNGKKKKEIEQNQESLNNTEVIIQQALLKDQKLQQEVRLVKLKADKEEGKLINTELVKYSVPEVIKNYKMLFVQQTEQLIRDILNELQVDNEKLTNTLTKLKEISNNSSTKANEEAKRVIKNVIIESQKIR